MTMLFAVILAASEDIVGYGKYKPALPKDSGCVPEPPDLIRCGNYVMGPDGKVTKREPQKKPPVKTREKARK